MRSARSLVIIMAMLMLLPVSVAWAWDDWGHSKPKPVSCTVGVDFWMEKFQGGSLGQQGNVLFATGPGFIFQNATLSKLEGPDSNGAFTTTYVGGELLLNSPCQLPWVKYGKFRATDLTATNVSIQPQPLTGPLTYTLTFSGRFDNDPDLCFAVKAEYSGTPAIVAPGGVPLLQKSSIQPDTGFKATLTLQHCRWW